ncbi:hypothetical protein ABIE28_001686 [Devosia sp. 2618]
MTLISSFRAFALSASSSRGQVSLRAAQLAENSLASAQLTGAMPLVPVIFGFSRARQIVEGGGHGGGEGHNRSFHAAVLARGHAAVMRHPAANLTHAVTP